MNNIPAIKIQSTSTNTADTSPVVLRKGELKRLVFRPMLVNNESSPEASVRGELVYQAKRKSEEWMDVESLSLTSVRAGENIRFELTSGEVLKLYQCLSALYKYMQDQGIQYGTKLLVPMNEAPGVKAILSSISSYPDREIVGGVLDWLQDRDTTMVADVLDHRTDESLTHLAVATGLARLRRFIEEAEASLDSDDEGLWDRLLTKNSWAVGQVYSCPIVIVRDQAYLGGKSLDRKGGNIADFLYRNQITDNAVIVEIKTPTTPLTGAKTYRNNAYACSKEMAGAVQQVLQNLYTYNENYYSISGDEPPDTRRFSPRMLLIIGNLQKEVEVARRRSFELYRNSLRSIDIVTFDELVAKAKLLLGLFSE